MDSKLHDYQRGEEVIVFDKGKWRKGKVVDANHPTSLVVHIDGYNNALSIDASDSRIRKAGGESE